jgi:hypothetical protein
MADVEAIKSTIRSVFDDVDFPGDWCLRGSNEGEEPRLLEREFRDKVDWLARADPVFHLTHGLRDHAKGERVNARRYGARTWFESSSHKLSVFNAAQAAAIVLYLKLKRERSEAAQDSIEQALNNFWLRRCAHSQG